jgi:hypothetical protein
MDIFNLTAGDLAKREKPIAGRGPIQFLKPVSSGSHQDRTADGILRFEAREIGVGKQANQTWTTVSAL